MPWLSLAQVKKDNPSFAAVAPRTNEPEIPLTLAQANHYAEIFDAIREDPKIENPWAVARAQFRKLYRVEGDKWVKRSTTEAQEMTLDDIYEALQEAGRRHSRADHDVLRKIKKLIDDLMAERAAAGGEGTQESGDIEIQEAEWDRAYINELADAAFAYISPGGKKDDDGKTVPRSLRHLPHHDKSVKKGTEQESIDKAHLRNALARAPQTKLPAAAKKAAIAHLQAHAKALGVGKAAEKEAEESADWGEPQEMALTECVALTEAYDPVTRDLPIIILEEGENPKKRRKYLRQAVLESAPMFKGLKMFLNHPTPEQKRQRPEGDVRNWASTVTESRGEGGNGTKARVVGTAHVFDDWLHKRLQDPVFTEAVGLSINVGRARMRRGTVNGQAHWEIVESLCPESQPRAPSVDWVTYAAQGGRVADLLESRRDDLMELDTITIKDLKEHRPDLLKEITEAGGDKKTEIVELRETVEGLQEDNKKLATKIAVGDQMMIVRKAVQESKLPALSQEKVAGELEKALLEGRLAFEDDPEDQKDRKTVTVKLQEAVAGRIKEERDYLAKVSGKPSIVGLGDDGGEKSVQESISERIERMATPTWETDEIPAVRKVHEAAGLVPLSSRGKTKDHDKED